MTLINKNDVLTRLQNQKALAEDGKREHAPGKSSMYQFYSGEINALEDVIEHVEGMQGDEVRPMDQLPEHEQVIELVNLNGVPSLIMEFYKTDVGEGNHVLFFGVQQKQLWNDLGDWIGWRPMHRPSEQR